MVIRWITTLFFLISNPEKDTGMGTHVTPSQRSFRGHLRLLTSNGQSVHNLSQYPHTLMDFHGT